MAVNELPDELLETIFLRLASPICLVRAASTCRRWCRIVADTGFLRLYRSKNVLTVGNYIATHTSYFAIWPRGPRSVMVGTVAFVPSGSSPATGTKTTMSDRFSLDFLLELNNGSHWGLADSHDGLLLLVPQSFSWGRKISVSIALCEPLTRRYRKVALPPLDNRDKHVMCLDAFLLCAGGGGDKDDRTVSVSSDFTVLLVLHHNGISTTISTTACIFSTRGADGGEEEMHLVRSEDLGVLTGNRFVGVDMQFAGRAGGSIYWSTARGAVIAFNESTGEFSSFKLPKYTDGNHSYQWCNFRVVVGTGAGTASIIRLVKNDLEVLTQLDGGSMEWTLEKTIRLSELTLGVPGWKDDFFFKFKTAAGAKILAVIGRSVVLTPSDHVCPFSVDLDTMEIERVYGWGNCGKWVFPYEPPWPPALPFLATTASQSSANNMLVKSINGLEMNE